MIYQGCKLTLLQV